MLALGFGTIQKISDGEWQLLSLTLWTIVRLRGVTLSPWQILLWCVSLILITDLLAVVSNSLWLSCTAVAALIFFLSVCAAAGTLPARLALVRHSLAAFAGRHDPAVVADAVFTVPRR